MSAFLQDVNAMLCHVLLVAFPVFERHALRPTDRACEVSRVVYRQRQGGSGWQLQTFAHLNGRRYYRPLRQGGRRRGRIGRKRFSVGRTMVVPRVHVHR